MADQLSTLVGLGFSEYEARTYKGLVGHAPMTGYAVARGTGVPQPKVYETLGRLATRGVVVQVSEDPATWVALPPTQLLAKFESDFRRQIATAELELSRLGDPLEKNRFRPYRELNSWPGVEEVAIAVLDEVEDRAYLSAHTDQLEQIAPHVMAADRRGVRIDVVCFGTPPFTLRNGSVVNHLSTEGTVYPHHQARHLALVVDGCHTVWALAKDGRNWVGISASDELLPAVVKGYIRHDLFVQRIYGDLRPELEAQYGPNLEALVRPHVPSADGDVSALGGEASSVGA